MGILGNSQHFGSGRRSHLKEESLKLLKGIHYGNASVKIYSCEGKSFLVVQKRYLFNNLHFNKKTLFDDIESAEDYVNSILAVKKKYYSI